MILKLANVQVVQQGSVVYGSISQGSQAIMADHGRAMMIRMSQHNHDRGQPHDQCHLIMITTAPLSSLPS